MLGVRQLDCPPSLSIRFSNREVERTLAVHTLAEDAHEAKQGRPTWEVGPVLCYAPLKT